MNKFIGGRHCYTKMSRLVLLYLLKLSAKEMYVKSQSWQHTPETHSQLSQTSKMEVFCENSEKLKTINYFREKLDLNV